MTKERKRVNSIILIVLFVSVFVLSVQMVVAETVFGNIANSITNAKLDFSFFSNLSDMPGLPKFLFFILITLIVFGVVDFMPFMPTSTTSKNWVSLIIAVIVGLLSSLYLTDEYIQSILLSYNALGVTLTAILPFAIIVGLSYKFYEQGFVLFSRFVWIVFLVVLGYIWGFADPSKIGTLGKWAYPIIFLLTLFMFIFERQLYKLFLKEGVTSKLDVLHEQLRAQSGKRRAEAEDVRSVGGGR